MDLATLATFAPFHRVEPAALEPLLSELVAHSYGPGDQVANQDEEARSLIFVLSGHLQGTWRNLADGLLYTGPRVGPGETVNANEAVLGLPIAMSLKAIGPIEAMELPTATLRARIDQEPILALAIMRSMAERLHTRPYIGGTSFVDLARLQTDESLWLLLQPAQILRYRALPLARHGNILVVGFCDASNLNIVDDVARLLPAFKVRPVPMEHREFELFHRSRVAPTIEKGKTEDHRDRWFNAIRNKTLDVRLVETQPASALEEKARYVSGDQVVALLNRILGEALELAASDIHIEPTEAEMTVRYRIDGLLKKRPDPIEARYHTPLVSRVKVMARMDMAEKRRAQDGRLTIEAAGRQLDLRLATVPTRFGEKLVMRILDSATILIDLERLMVHQPTYEAFRWMIDQPQGLVIVAGPTGSGKTTTIYSALLRLRQEEINIVTIEDPIEYTIDGVCQVQVNDAAGVSFASSVPHFLRQDPDVIIVGETRDPLTAATTVEAALTGHLVFTTLHTNDALGCIARLRDMNIDPFVQAHTLIGVVSQRLVRRVCPHCARPVAYHRDLVLPLGLFHADDMAGNFTFLKGSGCYACNFLGYRGRIGIYEVLRVDDRLRPLIAAAAPLTEVGRVAIEAGLLQPLAENCRHLLVNGLTTVEELARVLFVDHEAHKASAT